VIRRSPVNSSIAALPPKRPWPEALVLPNGIGPSSGTVGASMWQIPDWMRLGATASGCGSRIHRRIYQHHQIRHRVQADLPHHRKEKVSANLTRHAQFDD
jgi:hypothetical protein